MRELGSQAFGQTSKGIELTVLFVTHRVVQVHKLGHQRDRYSVGADQGSGQHIAVARLTFFRVMAPILQGSVNGDQPPPAEQSTAIEHTHLNESTRHVDGNLRDGLHRNPRGMMHGILRAGDGPPCSQTLFVPALLAQLYNIGG